MRISSALLCGALTACGGAEVQPPKAEPERIACAMNSVEPLAVTCTYERSQTAAGVVLTLRHPDGGFRRLLVSPDGTVTAADGAESVAVLASGSGEVEATVGGVRYRVPRRLLS